MACMGELYFGLRIAVFNNEQYLDAGERLDKGMSALLPLIPD